ncbi:phosphoribosylformylglycinamidine cyclo-ligase [Archaeoglobus profundus]|uniref:Phosphoribosylformylglycinamidine cyclo-ligase n=1 Tax=Archaeoglobus profundus (strain DSM 5631 / JCM 9629 / NBRC 100127 / Av18) TaxID=572546 RepID=D2RGN0_ARCPA|nr:phosphoribosylformylglycinamidine cyclo-ligase [Archaeoglobus profundus]ADB57455.1 phosphoribosylformylglycinamidine cyclo-ligase [Archaeoglobus profundus DSM 5631]
MEKFSYAKAGVDIRQEEKAVKSLVSKIKYVRQGFGKPILMGHYASVLDFGEVGVAITTDGVGTKIIVAEKLGKFDTIGIDCVAMNVNDLLAIGAEPIAMVDYIATFNPDERVMEQIAIGLEKGCEIANITLVGGETATLPDLIKGWDLVGTAIGVVDKDKIITGKDIQAGDVIFGVPSSGIHSNGLTLARKVIENAGLSYHDKFNGKTIGEELLTPTRIYIEILDVVRNCEVHGLAHITGGGLLNLKRLKNVKYVIDDPLKPQKIFRFIQELGKIDDDEMYRTFNMGMGFAIILPEEEVDCVKKYVDGKVVGFVEEGEGVYVKDMRIDKF